MAHPLLFDGTWLQQGKYESAEAFYQQVLAGTGGAAAGSSKVRHSYRISSSEISSAFSITFSCRIAADSFLSYFMLKKSGNIRFRYSGTVKFMLIGQTVQTKMAHSVMTGEQSKQDLQCSLFCICLLLAIGQL